MLHGVDPPVCHYKPSASNIAPRARGWVPSKGSKQAAPVSGSVSTWLRLAAVV